MVSSTLDNKVKDLELEYNNLQNDLKAIRDDLRIIDISDNLDKINQIETSQPLLNKNKVTLSVADYNNLINISKWALVDKRKSLMPYEELVYKYKKENEGMKEELEKKNSFSEISKLAKEKSNFCKIRLCPMCAWRRSLKIFGQTSKVMNKALEEKEYRFLFLTLTCKNVDGEDLSNQIDNLFYGFKKMSLRKDFKQAVKGWFRALEVTHNTNKISENYDTYHPHFHMILMVNKSYFSDSNQYITHEKWVELWKSCMKVDYDPMVNIKAFKTGTKSETEKSIAEVAKYTVKDDDLIIKDKNGQVDEELTDDAVFILDKALANRRLVAFHWKVGYSQYIKIV